MLKIRWLAVGLLLGGCDLTEPQGPVELPESQWERPEQRRLDTIGKKCGGQPWESAGVICPDDVVIITRADTTGDGG